MNYLTEVLDKLRQRAYFSRQLDWEALRAGMVADATTPADCYPAIRMVIEALNDNHSFFVGADQIDQTGPHGRPQIFGLYILSPGNVVTEVFPESPADKAGIAPRDVIEAINGLPPEDHGSGRVQIDTTKPARLRVRKAGGGEVFEVELVAETMVTTPRPYGKLLEERIGYLELFVQGLPDEQQLYADTLQSAIRKLSGQGARGWIVDLRRDRGGNMWPMIAGVGPLLGEGRLGGFVGVAGLERSWYYREGASRYDDPEKEGLTAFTTAGDPFPAFDVTETPVAVLTGHLTESAGEMILISFRGRPECRTFGEATAGQITAVAIHELEDGALLGIAESVCEDRQGTVYQAAIQPDEPVTVDWLAYGTADDPVLKAALRWLQSRLVHRGGSL